VCLDEARFQGRQARLLFAYLVAAAGRPVPRDELADALWGEHAPATWEKALTVLASRLRATLSESGANGSMSVTSAFGCYRLQLPAGTWVDVLAAESAARQAESALAAGDLEAARDAAAFAESVVRLQFLPGDDGAWVDAKRRELTEVRMRALAVLAEGALRAGDSAEAVRWAEREVEVVPFRESGYRRLMASHAAAGNRAEALQVYERCRRFLAEELGAYPSPETEAIYRDLLEAPPGPVVREGAGPPGAGSTLGGRRRRPALVAAGLVVLLAIGAAVAIVATRGDGRRSSSAAATPRVALVVARSSPGSDDPSAPYLAALDRAQSEYDIRTQTIPIDLSQPGLPASVRNSLGGFDLVLLAGQLVDARFVHEMALHPHTRFVVLDPDPDNTGPLYAAVSRLPNATDVFFIEGPGAYLAGYLSALMAKRAANGKRPVVLSVVAGDPEVNLDPVTGFSTGATAAVSDATVLQDYSNDFTHPATCAELANRQIDRGSTVVFAAAGGCSIGALTAAGERGVWAVGADRDMSSLGSQILVSTVKRLDQAADYAIRSYLNGTLPQGHLDIGIERDAVGIVGINHLVPASIRAEIAQVQKRQMREWASWATPLR
jgi:SARP family transcriptional regulator, regulator of embCAB operon